MGLALALAGVLSWRRQVADWITVARVADRAARRLSDVPLTLRAIENLGTALVEARRFTEAIDQLSTARLLGRLYFDDLAVEARVCDSLGLALQGIGDFSQAAHEHSTAIGIFQEIGDRHSQAQALTNLGLILRESQRFDESATAFIAAAYWHSQLGDRRGEASAWRDLQRTYLAADRPDHARRAAQRATPMGEADDIDDVEASERVLRGWRVHAEHGTADLP